MGRHGGQILIDQLDRQGAERVFTVPGESFLAALDGLAGHPRIQTIVCRHEGGAAMMAEAHGKLTRTPGICFVTRAPGATNASSGVHVARQDSTPMILFVGQVPRRFRGREAFQEVDLAAMFAPLAKWAAEIPATERIPEFVSKAYQIALSGRPGPVVLALPEDVLSAKADVTDTRRVRPARPSATAADRNAVLAALAEAERPLMILGGPDWSSACARTITGFAERFRLPTVTAFRYQDYIDNRRPEYAGHAGLGINPKLVERIRAADLLLIIGARMGEMSTRGYSMLAIPDPHQRLIHVHPSADELGSVYRPELGIVSTLASFAELLSDAAPARPVSWDAWTASARADYEANRTPGDARVGGLDLAQIVAGLSQQLPEDAIITNGAGNYTAWVHRYFVYKGYKTQLAPTAGSMGYGLPAAIAAKLAHPDRTVVCFAGDGCLMMTASELATAARHNAAVLVIVVNNSQYGTIRMHQARTYPHRVSGTSLTNPDFVALAKSFGAYAERADTTEAFWVALERAQASGTLALIELVVDPDQVAPGVKLSEIETD